MITNEFYIDSSSWGGAILMKVELSLNIDKANEIVTDYSWRGSSDVGVPFSILSSNVKDKKRFLRTSTAKDSISISHAFLHDKNPLDEKKCIDWFTRGEKQTRYLRFNTNDLFTDYTERRQLLGDLRKTKNPTKIIEKIKAKGLNVSAMNLSGPKAKMKLDHMNSFKIEGNIDIMDLIEKNKNNSEKAKMIAKYIIGGSYQFRFLDFG